MTTVAELIEALKDLPPEAEVKTLKETFSGFDLYTDWDDLELPESESNNFDLVGQTLYIGER